MQGWLSIGNSMRLNGLTPNHNDRLKRKGHVTPTDAEKGPDKTQRPLMLDPGVERRPQRPLTREPGVEGRPQRPLTLDPGVEGRPQRPLTLDPGVEGRPQRPLTLDPGVEGRPQRPLTLDPGVEGRPQRPLTLDPGVEGRPQRPLTLDPGVEGRPQRPLTLDPGVEGRPQRPLMLDPGVERRPQRPLTREPGVEGRPQRPLTLDPGVEGRPQRPLTLDPGVEGRGRPPSGREQSAHSGHCRVAHHGVLRRPCPITDEGLGGGAKVWFLPSGSSYPWCWCRPWQTLREDAHTSAQRTAHCAVGPEAAHLLKGSQTQVQPPGSVGACVGTLAPSPRLLPGAASGPVNVAQHTHREFPMERLNAHPDPSAEEVLTSQRRPRAFVPVVLQVGPSHPSPRRPHLDASGGDGSRRGTQLLTPLGTSCGPVTVQQSLWGQHHVQQSLDGTPSPGHWQNLCLGHPQLQLHTHVGHIQDMGSQR
ncbi:PREDICTED: uncharacterized protein LOC108539782 isoform X3 [Rhinopithecus bieti]|uniref:uncharacterized protein LOC108539782 isoform X2 n=1 Tax=Rhinopithecus bieti TaxID=61621 RepID=UPI00083C2D0B|nr:PREDICTED: uncharacterized protein LOC108539782 isoform X2 [Rhinopithecus bieti]XP_017744165.1 PREDICTED: uncharacterized protein LOC108539782 isoform X3 [Rhinopithecus bieti]